MKKIGIKLPDLQEKIDNGQRPEWVMRWVEKHTDHYADRGRTIAVVPLEAWNKVLDASGEPPKQSPDYGNTSKQNSIYSGRKDYTGCQSSKDKMKNKMKQEGSP